MCHLNIVFLRIINLKTENVIYIQAYQCPAFIAENNTRNKFSQALKSEDSEEAVVRSRRLTMFIKH